MAWGKGRTMRYCYGIMRHPSGDIVIDNLLLEQALALWEIQGYEHPEYRIIMHPDTRKPELSRNNLMNLVLVPDIESDHISSTTMSLLPDFEIHQFCREEYYGPSH